MEIEKNRGGPRLILVLDDQKCCSQQEIKRLVAQITWEIVAN